MTPRVLIVDDAAFIREVLTQILSLNGFDIIGEAADGVEAIEAAETLKPDLIIMDIVMPHKSGIQATLEILARSPSTKIVACSTEGSESMIVKALESGCVDYIVKPFQTQQILEQLRKVIGKGTAL